MEGLVDFASRIRRGSDITDVLNYLAVRVPDVLGIAGAGVSLKSGQKVMVATSSSERAGILERVQQEQQAGPCMEAIRSGQEREYRDIRLERNRWPDYVATASRVGILAVAALPMGDGPRFGAFDLYDDRVHDWTAEELATARVFDDIASSYLMSASTLEHERRTVEQLQQALENRVIIEQAKGSIAASEGIGVDDAFLRLRKYARDHRANLRDVAHAVVALGLRI